VTRSRRPAAADPWYRVAVGTVVRLALGGRLGRRIDGVLAAIAAQAVEGEGGPLEVIRPVDAARVGVDPTVDHPARVPDVVHHLLQAGFGHFSSPLATAGSRRLMSKS
jgi:hypothetical protein